MRGSHLFFLLLFLTSNEGLALIGQSGSCGTSCMMQRSYWNSNQGWYPYPRLKPHYLQRPYTNNFRYPGQYLYYQSHGAPWWTPQYQYNCPSCQLNYQQNMWQQQSAPMIWQNQQNSGQSHPFSWNRTSQNLETQT